MSASLDALDPALRAFVHAVCSEGARLADGRTLDWPQQRAIAEAVRTRWRAGGPVMADTTTLRIAHGIDGFDVCVHRPQGIAARAPALMYLHGGGWCLFSLDTHDRLMRELAERAGVVVIGVEYALAPEHPYPVALEQCIAAIRALREQPEAFGIDTSRLALGGDSAGANLALATALRLRDVGAHAGIEALLLLYGAFDTALDADAVRTLGTAEDMLSADEMAAYWTAYLGPDAAACRDGYAVPAHADLHELPPTLLLWGERDVLAAQNATMASRLRAAGVHVDAHAYPRTPHSFIEAMSTSEIARDALARGADWLRSHLAVTHDACA
ncbi:alpha/beta hydrolase [Luteimonas sp. 3794]|uniref:alpha/beta hydrolase n=1 Tax=Luteimonas sp. 3794 TaxID=2817730 RepID=UPI00286268C1|nr:alpha/beta hydrolase [Luteimonas sp. 3794]MDR6990330.1 acetyl esterase [Luteimonas sp. 3794]